MKTAIVWTCAAMAAAAGAALAHGGHEHVAGSDSLEVAPGSAVFEARGIDFRFPAEMTVRRPAMRLDLRALGSGLRKKYFFKVYEVALYSDPSIDLGDDPYGRLIRGGFARALQIQFVRDVGGERILDAFQKGLDRAAADLHVDVPDDVRGLMLSAFEGGIRQGDSILLVWVPGAGLHVRMGGHWHRAILHEGLSQAMMAIWLGEHPVSDGLRKDLLRLYRSGE